MASCYDEAGRVSEVRQKQNATAAEVLVGKVTDYAEHGPVREMKIGPGAGVVTETSGYDSKRLQMRRVTAASAAESWTVKNFFCPTGLETDQCTENSGNVLKQEGIGGLAWNYTYDPLNRLKRAVETVGGVEKWHQTMKYDPYGNRSVVNDAGTLITQEKAMPRVASEADASPFDAKNQWTGAQYDVGGNQQTSWGDGTEIGASKYRYDGEGKQVKAEVRYSASVTGVVEHGFDGEGRRVWKKVDGVVKTVFVYDAMGQLVAEYGESGTMPCGTCYLTADHLGSTRVVWGTDGRMKQLMDYAPFGEEVGANYRGGDVRYPGEVYPRAGGVGVSMKFTGKERDGETGLDYFGARYMSAAQGRFTSPDWSETPQPVPYADFPDPQTLNLYSYARNNPLIFTDPDGHCPWCIGAVVGGVGGAAASYISQKVSNPDKPINWKSVIAGGVGGAVAGGTLGLATAPAALTTIGGTTLVETGVAVKVTTAGITGVAGGIVSRGIENNVDPNKTIGTPTELATDALVGAAGEGLSKAAEPLVKATTTAGRVVTLNEARVAAGTRTPLSFGVRQAELKTQQQVAGGAAGASVDTAAKARQDASARQASEAKRREQEQH